MTQVFSQNGWPAYDTTAHFTRFTAGEQKWWAANDDVAVVFGEFVKEFVRRIEKIKGPILDDWSYANRLVRGSTKTVSNHGSATAIDLNSLQHPRGVPNTFSKAEQIIMRDIKNKITDNAGVSVLRLGMDYKTVVDDMHVEINASPAKVKQAANKIRARNAPKPPKAKPPVVVTPPKETPVPIEKVNLNLDQEFVLGPTASAYLDTPEQPHPPGSKINMDFIVQWGGPGIFRIFRILTGTSKEVTELKQKVTDLQNVIAPMRGDIARLESKIDALIAKNT